MAVPNGAIKRGDNPSVAEYTAKTRPSSSGSTTLAATDLAIAEGNIRNMPSPDASQTNQL